MKQILKTPLRQLCLATLAIQLITFSPGNALSADKEELEPLRLSFLGSTASGPECEQHGPPQNQANKKKKPSGRPAPRFESEHRPSPKRIYYFNDHRRRATVKSYIRRPDGKVIEPELRLGYKPNVSFSTPFGDGPFHGANNVYVVEEGIDENVLTIRCAKWITMHHSCGWGHDGKFDKNLTVPQPLTTIPFEIVVDKLWDPNFHLAVSSGDNLEVTVLSYGKPVRGALVTLSTEKGWSKTVKTDKNGKTTLQLIRDYYPPMWSAFKRTRRSEFLITARHQLENQGTYRGKGYEKTKYIATLPWQYTPSTRDYASYAFGLGLGALAMTVSGFGVFIYRERRKKTYKGISFNE